MNAKPAQIAKPTAQKARPLAPTGLSWLTKQVLERMLAGLLVLVLSPLLLAISAAVWLESGAPVLFLQPRFGRHGKPFSVFKFRTMRTGACDRSGANQTADHDPRITRVGQVLRKTSLDELPQLCNVVLGQMALIGPRAHPCGMCVGGTLCEVLEARYHLRHIVKPGITGWAQINGSRGAVKTAAMLAHRVELDLEYIERWSLWLDLKIFLRTFGVVLTRKQAV